MRKPARSGGSFQRSLYSRRLYHRPPALPFEVEAPAEFPGADHDRVVAHFRHFGHETRLIGQSQQFPLQPGQDVAGDLGGGENAVLTDDVQVVHAILAKRGKFRIGLQAR